MILAKKLMSMSVEKSPIEEHGQYMVDQLTIFPAEVTRVAKEVGTDGKLGGQAVVAVLAELGKI